MTPHASEAEKALAEALAKSGIRWKVSYSSLPGHFQFEAEGLNWMLQHGPALLAEIEVLRKECAALQAALSGRTGEAGSA